MSVMVNMEAEQFAYARTGRTPGPVWDDPVFLAWYELYAEEGENAANFRYLGTFDDDQSFIAEAAAEQGCPDWVMIDYDRTAIGFMQGVESVATQYGKAYFR